MNRNFIEKLRLISIRDIISLIFIFPIAYVISLFFRRKNKNLILICESEKKLEIMDIGCLNILEKITQRKM